MSQLPFSVVQTLLKARKSSHQGQREHKTKHAKQDASYTQCSYNTMVWLQNHVTYEDADMNRHVHTKNLQALVAKHFETRSATKALSNLRIMIQLLEDSDPQQYDWGNLNTYEEAKAYIIQMFNDASSVVVLRAEDPDKVDPKEAKMYRPWLVVKSIGARFIAEHSGIWNTDSDTAALLHDRQDCLRLMLLLNNGPPRRNEHMLLQCKKQADEPSNWVDWENRTIVYETYKTSLTYGTSVQKLNDATFKLLSLIVESKTWQEGNQTPYLFQRGGNEDGNASSVIQKTFQRAMGIPYSTRILRKIYITYLHQTKKIHGSWRNMAKYANAMGHSVYCQQSFYTKMFDERVQRADDLEEGEIIEEDEITPLDMEEGEIASNLAGSAQLSRESDCTEAQENAVTEQPRIIAQVQPPPPIIEISDEDDLLIVKTEPKVNDDLTVQEIHQRVVDDLVDDPVLTKDGCVLWSKVLRSRQIAFNGKSIAENLLSLEGDTAAKKKRLLYLKNHSTKWNPMDVVAKKRENARLNAKNHREQKKQKAESPPPSSNTHIRFDI